MSKIDYQALREAAEKAGEDKWQAKKINGDFFVIRHGSYTRQHGYTSYQPIAEIDCKPVRDFVAKANPATVLALLDELEAAKKRIAELDAREIKPAKGEVLVVVSGFTGCGKSAIAGEIEIAMKAIGVPVNWTNGDAEKRMTGADWLTAIEMYKPTVRIVEVNVPRVAGICIKGDAGEQNDEKP
ncbi:ead/Ea22-like family protein [Escherichia coli]|uniref:ead/Ea22-like family protein n=1 Tax=Escherichia coli TaxID=562 RepID=UPI000DA54EDB|nr:ead/Ea22-like family protein [Escherichia coli]QMP36949.1 ead/Ea22-like family protein [Escherichia coli]SQS80699.1 putative EA22-like protein [Escherichia coli]